MENENTDTVDLGASAPQTLVINNNSKAYLLEIAKWSKLFAILGFVAVVFLVLASLFIGSLMQLFSNFAASAPTIDGAENPMENLGDGISAIFTVLYLIIAALYFFPSFYLYKFSNKMKSGLLADDNFDVEEGFKNLKSTFKFWGVVTVLVLAFYAFSFIAGILSAVFL